MPENKDLVNNVLLQDLHQRVRKQVALDDMARNTIEDTAEYDKANKALDEGKAQLAKATDRLCQLTPPTVTKVNERLSDAERQVIRKLHDAVTSIKANYSQSGLDEMRQCSEALHNVFVGKVAKGLEEAPIWVPTKSKQSYHDLSPR